MYDAETNFWGECSKLLGTLTSILPSCWNLLKHNVAWWLDGKGLQIVDESVSDIERSRFRLFFRAAYFSILMVDSYSAGKKMLGAIIKKEPTETPMHDGKDLWLQRVEALKFTIWWGLSYASSI